MTATLAAGCSSSGGGTGSPAQDAGLGGPDATVVEPDAVVRTPDATVVEPDAGVVAPDATLVEPDATAVGPDATVVDPDATAVDPDATAVDPDATVVEPDATVVPPGEPIVVPAGQWTFVDFPDTTCDDGSPTGLAVRTGDPNHVAIFLNGGGFCWDAETCLVLNTAARGPFGAAQFAQMAGALGGTLLDRDAPGSPFSGWSMVFLPYCTGDAHIGERTARYDPGDGRSVDFQHRGGANFDAFMRRIAATWPAPQAFALVGPSAGGLGALVDYAHARAHWPAGQGLLYADGFPPLRGAAYPAGRLAAWDAAWGMGARLGGLCAGCEADPAALLPALSAAYPGDRFALSFSTRDAVLSSYVTLPADAYAAAVTDARDHVYAGLQNVHTFAIEGVQHTLLLHPEAVSVGGTTLQSWLSAQVAGDPAWANVGP